MAILRPPRKPLLGSFRIGTNRCDEPMSIQPPKNVQYARTLQPFGVSLAIRSRRQPHQADIVIQAVSWRDAIAGGTWENFPVFIATGQNVRVFDILFDMASLPKSVAPGVVIAEGFASGYVGGQWAIALTNTNGAANRFDPPNTSFLYQSAADQTDCTNINLGYYTGIGNGVLRGNSGPPPSSLAAPTWYLKIL